jgi:hypothetical protein
MTAIEELIDFLEKKSQCCADNTKTTRTMKFAYGNAAAIAKASLVKEKRQIEDAHMAGQRTVLSDKYSVDAYEALVYYTELSGKK